jgi:hypothetical protein
MLRLRQVGRRVAGLAVGRGTTAEEQAGDQQRAERADQSRHDDADGAHRGQDVAQQQARPTSRTSHHRRHRDGDQRATEHLESTRKTGGRGAAGDLLGQEGADGDTGGEPDPTQHL